MTGTYANNPPTLTLADIEAGMEAMQALPRMEADVTMAPDVWEALQTRLPTVEMDPVLGVRVHVDDRLPEGAWHRGAPMT